MTVFVKLFYRLENKTTVKQNINRPSKQNNITET